MADFTDLVVTDAGAVSLSRPDDAGAFLDPLAPTVVFVTSEGAVDKTAAVVVDVLDDRGLRAVLVTFGDVLVYDGTSFSAGFSSSAQAPVTGGTRLSLVRNQGWPKGDFVLRVVAVDAGGNVTTGLGNFTVATAPIMQDQSDIGLVYQPDHAGEAASRLLQQFDNAAKLHAFVRALVGPMQELEQHAFDVIGAFDVDTAYGAQLDVVGGFVGVLRESRSDIAYRAYIKAKILANQSDGAVETILGIARALLGPDVLSLTYIPGFTESHPAHYTLDVHAGTLRYPWDPAGSESPETVARSLADALFLATSAGVSFTLFYQYTDDEHAFTLSSVGDAEEDSATQGLADASDEDVMGGALIGVEERW